LIVVIIIVVVVVVIAIPESDEKPTPTITPPPATATTSAPAATPTDTPTPTPTAIPTPKTRACTVKEGAYCYNEPHPDSPSQSLAEGTVIGVVDTVEGDGHTWYQVWLSAYNVMRYVPVEAVECD
jgi:hypothetical protein